MSKLQYEVLVYGDKAYMDERSINKDEILERITYERGKSTINKSRKENNKFGFNYIFETDDSVIKLVFSKECEEKNKSDIEKLDKLCVIDKERTLKKLRTLLIILSFGVVTGFSISESIDKTKLVDHFEISTLDKELELHANNEEHRCKFGAELKEMYYEIMEYVSEKELPSGIALEALKKYNCLLDKDVSSAEEINLHKVYKKEQKTK